MAVDLAAPVLRSRVLLRTGAISVSARAVLGGIVALSAVARGIAALAHVTPYYFPDEYLYSALARGIAQGHGPVVRGAFVHFPALLQPLLTAPFWIPNEPALALRLTEGLNAVAMSLAAIPVYLLARRLGLREGIALGSALVAVACPDLVFASFTLSDPIAYPLVLAAVYTGVVALDKPTPRAQLAFFAFAALASFARVQYAALPLAFFAAALILDRHRAVVRYRLTLALFGVPALGVLALGPARILGAYSGVASVGIHPITILHWVANDSMLLIYASGVVLVPGALAGLFTARERAEKAFALFTLVFAAAVLLQAGFIASYDSHRVQERYLFPLLPLIAPAFGLALKRGKNAQRLAFALAGGVLLLALRVPLSGFAAAHGKDDSPTLTAVLRLEQLVQTGNGSLIVALLAVLFAGLGAAVVVRPRFTAVPALLLTAAACTALSLGAQSYDSINAHDLRAHDMPTDARWVDHANVGSVTLLEAPGSIPPHALEALWWNTSVDRELFFGSGTATDHFGGTQRAYVARDGRLIAYGRTVHGPLLVQTAGSQIAFANAVLVARGIGFELFRPNGPARLTMLADGLYSDGWLSRSGALTIWPDANGVTAGTVQIEVSMPEGAEVTPFSFGTKTVRVLPGKSVVVTLHISGKGPRTIHWSTPRGGFASGSRPVSVLATAPTFRRTNGALLVCGPTASV
ncbi:MAG: hypothetical protein ACYDA3_07040 [Gaiellaceae bacterium]